MREQVLLWILALAVSAYALVEVRREKLSRDEMWRRNSRRDNNGRREND